MGHHYWTGYGLVTFIIGVLGLGATGQLEQHIPQTYALLAGMLVAAALNFLFSLWLGRENRWRVVRDVETGDHYRLLPSSSFFFIAVRDWTALFVALGIGSFLLRTFWWGI